MDRNKALGAYFGAAIADAMGGPVECQHAARIRKHYGRITGFLAYAKPPGLIDLQSGYALHRQPGSITDDTYIRTEVTHFILDTRPPRTPAQLADWMWKHADFNQWPYPAVKSLLRVVRGQASAEEAGNGTEQGGFVGWWTAIGIVHAGDPGGAAAEARSLCRIFKAPLEQDILSGVQSGVAEGLKAGATVDSVIDAVLAPCGPLARKTLERAVEIGRKAKTHDKLVEGLYANCLYKQFPTAADAPLPPPLKPVDYSDEFYTSVLLAEQIALAIASFAFSRGDPKESVPNVVMVGRDCDSSGTAVGSWVGALHGADAFPRGWVDTVCEANKGEIDIRGDGERLVAYAERQ
jgi:ADP-ribosylglycohydrolase